MRRIIVLIVSIILLVFAAIFMKNITSMLEEKTLADGEVKFEVEEIRSINMPPDTEKIITTLDELKPIVNEHNFNTKHSYIYIRVNCDNKHRYTITNVVKSQNEVTCIIKKEALKENITEEQIEIMREYIIDVNGMLEKGMHVSINITE